MTSQILFAVNCNGCGANLGATPNIEVPYFHQVFCRECIRPLQTRIHEDSLIDECLNDLSNPIMLQLHREANEILQQSNIGAMYNWWDRDTASDNSLTDNISLDSGGEMWENTAATDNNGEEDQQ